MAAGPEGVADHVFHAQRLAVDLDDVAVVGDGAVLVMVHTPLLLYLRSLFGRNPRRPGPTNSHTVDFRVPCATTGRALPCARVHFQPSIHPAGQEESPS